MLGELPDGWTRPRLGEMIRIITDGITANDLAALPEVYHYSLPAFDAGRQLEVGPGSAIKSNKTVVPADCVLFSKLNPRIPRIWRVSGHASPRSYCSTEFWPLVAQMKGVDLDYLAHYLASSEFLGHPSISPSSSTNSHKRVDRRAFEAFLLPLPPLDEQRRIAEVLRSVDEAIAAARNVVDQANANLEVIIAALIGRPQGKLPHWRYGRCDTFFVLQRGFDITETQATPGPYRVISSSGPTYPHSQYAVAGPAVITGRKGRLGTVFFSDDPCWPHDTTLWVKDFKGNHPRFIYWKLRQMNLSAYDAATSVPTLNRNNVHALEIAFPPIAEQIDIAETLDTLLSAIEQAEGYLAALQRIKVNVSCDLFSGRVRVPVTNSLSSNIVQPAFKRAVFAAEVVYQLHNDNRFGSVKHEKIVYLCELHIGLQRDLDRHAYKKAAGPYDPVARRSVEAIFRQQKWFGASKPDGKRVVYEPLEKAGDHRPYFERYFDAHTAAIQSIIDLLRPLDTEHCEVIATAYAVWNDFLIDGKQPSDAEIVASILNDWHPAKRRIAENRWLAILPWMRLQGLVPQGSGEKTRTAST